MGKKRILFYVENYLPYTETFIYDQLRSLQKSFNVFVLCERIIENPDFEIEPNKLFCIDFPPNGRIVEGLNRRGLYLRNRSKSKRVKSVINFIKPDIIIIHFLPNALRFNSYNSRFNGKVIVFLHGYDVSSLLKMSFFYRNGLTRISENYKCLIVSKGLERIMNSYFKRPIKSQIFYLGIDTSFFNRTNYLIENNKFICVSSFTEKKGHEYLLKAIAKLDTKPVFTFVGDGPLLNHIKELAQKLSIQKYVSFEGQCDRNKLRNLLDLNKYFVHPSVTASDGNTEGLPISILEAMSMEMPIISTFHSGIPEVVSDKNGILIAEKNVTDLAKAIISIQSWSFRANNRNKIIRDHNITNVTHLLSDEILKS